MQRVTSANQSLSSALQDQIVLHTQLLPMTASNAWIDLRSNVTPPDSSFTENCQHLENRPQRDPETGRDQNHGSIYCASGPDELRELDAVIHFQESCPSVLSLSRPRHGDDSALCSGAPTNRTQNRAVFS